MPLNGGKGQNSQRKVEFTLVQIPNPISSVAFHLGTIVLEIGKAYIQFVAKVSHESLVVIKRPALEMHCLCHPENVS